MQIIEGQPITDFFKLVWAWWHQGQVVMSYSSSDKVVVYRNPIQRFLYMNDGLATLGESIRYRDINVKEWIKQNGKRNKR